MAIFYETDILVVGAKYWLQFYKFLREIVDNCQEMCYKPLRVELAIIIVPTAIELS
jgi:hypothetical protein